MSGTFKVKNFERFQHYGDKRTPPWIKLYNELLDDYEFGQLPDHVKAHLTAIWLLASRYKNEIPYDPEWIARRINATEPVDLELLHSKGFIVVNQGCSKTLASREQGAIPDKDVDVEKERTLPPTQATGGAVVRMDKGDYPEAFETLWTAYRPIAGKNATKADAFSAWKKLSAEDRQRCLDGLKGYVVWLRKEREKRADFPAKHLATFINKRGWETILETDRPAIPQTWITTDSALWAPAAERWRREKNRDPPVTTSRHEAGEGAWFPSDWIKQEKAA